MRLSNYKRNKGFTLVELIIVIAIIGILAGVMLPQINTMVMSAHEKKLNTLFTGIQTGFRQYIGNSGIGNTVNGDDMVAFKVNKNLDPALALTPYDPAVPFTFGAEAGGKNPYGVNVASTPNTDGLFVSKGADRWGTPLYIKMQKLNDHSLILIIKSYGPDKEANTGDDVVMFTHYVKGFIRTASLGLQSDKGVVLNQGTMDRSVDLFTLRYSSTPGTSSNTIIADDFEVTD